jgi:hypothetical protein
MLAMAGRQNLLDLGRRRNETFGGEMMAFILPVGGLAGFH